MRYIAAYAGHSWELFAFRTWLPAFLAAAALASGSTLTSSGIGLLAMALTMLGLPSSILGNELATRFGRRRFLRIVMTGSAAIGAVIGFMVSMPFWLILAVLTLYAALIMADSAAITVGTLSRAPPERCGAVIGLQTMLASSMAMISPLMAGFMLDYAGPSSGWGLAFLVSAIGALAGAACLTLIGRQQASCD